MADISSLLFLRHLRADPTSYVKHMRRGKVAHDAVGESFWFRPLVAALSEVPVNDREQPLLFHARSADYQQISVQATLTYRIVDPALAATRLDFAIDPATGAWRSTPLEQLGGLLTERAQQHAVELLATMTLQAALVGGMTATRERIASGLATDSRLPAIGVEVIDVRVVAVRAEPDLERALQMPARELVQQDADRATFERRALAVERERAISENELQNQIELAKRHEQLVTQEGQNARTRATEEAAAERIKSEAAALSERLHAETRAETERLLADAKADATRAVGTAEADAETARLGAYRQVDAATILALAAQELASALPNIGTLNLSPDLLTSLVAGLSRHPVLPER